MPLGTAGQIRPLGEFFKAFKGVNFRIPAPDKNKYEVPSNYKRPEFSKTLNEEEAKKFLSNLHRIKASTDLYQSSAGFATEVAKLQEQFIDKTKVKNNSNALKEFLKHIQNFINLLNEKDHLDNVKYSQLLFHQNGMPAIIGEKLKSRFPNTKVPRNAHVEYKPLERPPMQYSLTEGIHGDGIVRYDLEVDPDNNIKSLRFHSSTSANGHGGEFTADQAYIELKANPKNKDELLIDTGSYLSSLSGWNRVLESK